MTLTGSSLSGELLDRRYRVDQLLARGGMSAVYRGLDTRLARPVAIKVMDSRFADDRVFLERFEHEARSAARLHHPHVVAVHDQGFDTAAGPENKRVFLVMELVDGGTLRDLLQEHGALAPSLALTILEQVLSALAAAHTIGLAHRDIKPENVLVGRDGTGNGTVKVGDFGLVRAVANAGTTSTSVILGTVAYLPPEQVTSGSADARADVYSAGILLHEMLTGQVPYTGDTALSVAYQHVHNDVPPPSRTHPGLPPALDELVQQATRRDVDSRPADADSLRSELNRVRAQLDLAGTAIPLPTVEEEPADPEATVPGIPRQTPGETGTGPRGTQALPRELLQTSGDPAPGSAPDARGRTHPLRSGPRGLLWPTLWVLTGLVLMAGIGTGVWWLTSGRWVDVPDLAGMEKEEAGQTLHDAELSPEFTEERHNTVPRGTVVRTDPDADGRAVRSDDITVVVSLGRPIVPDVPSGVSVGEAEQAIRAAELRPHRDPESDRYSTSVPEGAVISVDPQPGNQAEVGDRVTLVVSQGPPPDPVPAVEGSEREEAFHQLREAGFEPHEAGVEFSPDIPEDRVVRTDPPIDTPAEEGTRVDVYLSNAVEVPMVMAQSAEDAAQTLTESGLEVSGADETGRLPLVIRQDPGPGTLVEPGTTVTLTTL